MVSEGFRAACCQHASKAGLLPRRPLQRAGCNRRARWRAPKVLFVHGVVCEKACCGAHLREEPVREEPAMVGGRGGRCAAGAAGQFSSWALTSKLLPRRPLPRAGCGRRARWATRCWRCWAPQAWPSRAASAPRRACRRLPSWRPFPARPPATSTGLWTWTRERWQGV